MGLECPEGAAAAAQAVWAGMIRPRPEAAKPARRPQRPGNRRAGIAGPRDDPIGLRQLLEKSRRVVERIRGETRVEMFGDFQIAAPAGKGEVARSYQQVRIVIREQRATFSATPGLHCLPPHCG